jgi:hypothetical protein
MVFIRSGATGTRGALGATLHHVVGAKKIVQSSVSELLGPTFFLWPRAVGTCSTPGAVLCREAGARAHGTCVGPGAALSW